MPTETMTLAASPAAAPARSAKAKKTSASQKAAEKTKKTTTKRARKAASTKTGRRASKAKSPRPFELPPSATEQETVRGKEKKDLLFALDIGTRSVIGIVAAEANGTITILDTQRQEHKTRAMLDGQIHDVPQVAGLIRDIKEALEANTGTLRRVSVAAAGRALYTITAEAELEFDSLITSEQERLLDFAGVQAAQAKLTAAADIDDPTRYYCVGYSTIQYTLDDTPLKTLVGQRGHLAKATVIATFLPRQVIDSMDAALQATGLDMQAITLEPIAAINVLIPSTMRHLNLVLVDIGAGTSDVAITKDGAVIAYGMVPMAGDEITEAISQKFLLDFNVAEAIKRETAEGRDVSFTDILGLPHDMKAEEIIDPILPQVQKLAEAIAQQILALNGSEPQAVLLVGGGALTPQLAAKVAEALGLPPARVAVRRPENIDGIHEIPDSLRLPDAVTPLGILKIASLNTLHFLTVSVNGEEYRLFNFRDLTISDALLSAGIQMKKFNGKPGLGIQILVNGQAKFCPGTMGTLATLKLDGAPAAIDQPIHDGCRIEIEPGQDGAAPDIFVPSILEMPSDVTLYINGEAKSFTPEVLINDAPAQLEQPLKDGDQVTTRDVRTVGEALAAIGYPPTGRKISFTLNDVSSQHTIKPVIFLNDQPATLSMPVAEGDRIEYQRNDEPKLGDILNIEDFAAYITILYNGAEQKIPSAVVSLEVNGRPATTNTIITNGSRIKYSHSEQRATLVSSALAAVNFVPPPATSQVRVEIYVNNAPAQFTDPIKSGDSLDIKILPASAPTAATAAAAAPASPQPALKDSLLGDYLKQLQEEAAPAPEAATPPPAPKPAEKTGWNRFK